MKQTDEILLSEKLAGANDSVYSDFLKRSKDIQVWSEEGQSYIHLNKEAQYIVVNYSYFIYEYLVRNNTREIDYRVVRKFAKQYKNMVEYLFDKPSLQTKLNAWLKEKVDMVEMGMYTPTNSYNKNVYH